jgi:hypothetical protein
VAERAARCVQAGLARAALLCAALCALVPGPVRAGEAPVEDAPPRAESPAATGPGQWLGAPPTRLTAEQVLADVDPSGPLAPDTAREALRRLPQAREASRDALLRERIDCYRRFFVNRCLADVGSRERRVTNRIDAIEVRARQSLREQAAYERAEREARGLSEAARSEQAEADRRRENREAFAAREAAAAEDRARREREAPELERREAANRAAREKREAAVAQRGAQAASRAAQAPTNATAREREIADAERRRVQADTREAARRERRRQDAERRVDEAEERRRRAERREAQAADPREPPRAEPPASPPGETGPPAAR